MAVKLIVVGDTKESYFQQTEKEYLKRLGKYIKLTYTVVSSSKKSTSKQDCLQMEEEQLLKNINSTDFVILLDENGQQFTSRKFADNLNKWLYGQPNLVFIIGGAFGFSEKVKSRSNALLSLSKLTFPHHMVRSVFLEQLYRAFTILKGEKYHND